MSFPYCMGDIYLRFALDLSKIRDIVRIAEFEKKLIQWLNEDVTVLLQSKKNIHKYFYKRGIE